MDHAEAVAKQVFEHVLSGTRMDYHDSQNRGEHDFDLCYPDGRVCPVEVTSAVDRPTEATNAAILNKKRGGPAIKAVLCKKDWYITPTQKASINRIRSCADKYLSAIESEGLDQFFGPNCPDSPGVQRIWREIGVLSGAVLPWKEPGYIRISPPGGGGALNADTVIEAAKSEAFKDDNRRKLGLVADERHLAVYVYMTNFLPWCALVDFEPPAVLPNLPSEITDIWVFSETGLANEYVVWRASTLVPWRRITVRLSDHAPTA